MKKILINSFLNIFSRIKICYVRIGLRANALFAKLFYSKQFEEEQATGGAARGIGKRIVFGKYASRHAYL